MRLIPLKSLIILENRQRQEFNPDHLQELRNSIVAGGLQHAPVVRQTPEGDVLVSGESRTKAIEEIHFLGEQFKYDNQIVPEGMLPVVSLGELSELEAEEAELDENLKRKDLTWQELAAATQRLHNLRVKQNAIARSAPDVSYDNPPPPLHTVADTAKELKGRSDGAYQDDVRKEIIVANHLDNPLIAKAKSADEAFKILKKEEQRTQNIALAVAVGKTFSHDMHRIFHTDCLSWMAQPENAEQFDVILTDPPYGMGADSFGDAGGKLSGIEHHYDDSLESWMTLMESWTKLSFQIAKPQAHAYVFCDIDNFGMLKDMMKLAGWYVFRTPLINHKINSGRVPLPDRGPRRQYEIILYAIKGNMPVTHIYSDVISSTADEQMSHGAQKPVAVYQNLLQRSVKPGMSVIDCFGGSGTLLPAAHSYRCKATILEQNPEYYALCLKRAKELRDADEAGAGLMELAPL